ncbi:MAG TPA: sigma-70 family RNA polymerase sigma factor [Thermoguttaceae bacterium]|nr:sigma-70 family RNA polymerase sigma factor [Thermoguttaceae bacterium]
MITQYRQTVREKTSPERLVGAAQRGDRDAFGELITRYERSVYAVAFRRLGNHAEAQELCQEVFMQAMRKIDQLRDPRCFGGWLRSIANRMAINRVLRRAPLSSTDSQAYDGYCVEHRTPLAGVLVREREDQVHLGLGRLRALDRDTLVAFYFDGRSLVEMSEEFDSPVGTIKRRLHTARKRLAKELEALASA